MLFRFLLQFAEDRATAQDWTQRAFIKAFNRLDQFAGQSGFKTWIFTIGLNEMRSDKRIKWKFESFDAQVHEPILDSDFSDDDWMSARIAIRNLDAKQRMVFLLYEIEGYSHKEIAGMLDIAESYSRVILTRAKKELNQLIDQ